MELLLSVKNVFVAQINIKQLIQSEMCVFGKTLLFFKINEKNT